MFETSAQKNNIPGSKGFSLVEIAAVVGIFSILAAAAVNTSFRVLRSNTLLKDAQYLVIRELEEARSRAATGFGTKDHGVFIEDIRVTLFEGDTYLPGNGTPLLLPLTTKTDKTGVAIIFKRLSGKTNGAFTVAISNAAGASAFIDVSNDGSIIPH